MKHIQKKYFSRSVKILFWILNIILLYGINSPVYADTANPQCHLPKNHFLQENGFTSTILDEWQDTFDEFQNFNQDQSFSTASSNKCGGTSTPYQSRWKSYNPQNGQTDWIYRFRLGTSKPVCFQLLYQPAWVCWPMSPWGFNYNYKMYYSNGYWYMEVVLNPSLVCTMTCYCTGYFEMGYR